MMYEVIGAVIYTIIDNWICLDYLSLIQDKLSKHYIMFGKNKLKNCLGR